MLDIGRANCLRPGGPSKSSLDRQVGAYIVIDLIFLGPGCPYLPLGAHLQRRTTALSFLAKLPRRPVPDDASWPPSPPASARSYKSRLQTSIETSQSGRPYRRTSICP